MQKRPLVLAVALALSAPLVLPANAQPATNATESAATGYTRTITKRSADIVTALALLDAAKANIPSDVKPSRRQRRKQKALIEGEDAAQADGEDLDADLVK